MKIFDIAIQISEFRLS